MTQSVGREADRDKDLVGEGTSSTTTTTTTTTAQKSVDAAKKLIGRWYRGSDEKVPAVMTKSVGREGEVTNSTTTTTTTTTAQESVDAAMN